MTEFVVPEHEIRPVWFGPHSAALGYEPDHFECEGAGVIGHGNDRESAYANWLSALRESRRAMGGLELPE